MLKKWEAKVTYETKRVRNGEAYAEENHCVVAYYAGSFMTATAILPDMLDPDVRRRVTGCEMRSVEEQ